MNLLDRKRLEAWSLDDIIVASEHLNIPGRWKAVGNQTWFIYKDEMTEQEAKLYADELNQNKKLNLTYSDE